MLCPTCEINVRASRLLEDGEIVEYECDECFTDWHVHLETINNVGGPSIVVRDDSAQWWLVTDEGTGENFQRPGRRRAIQSALDALQKEMLDTQTIHKMERTAYTYTLSADPEHPATPGMLGATITISADMRPGVAPVGAAPNRAWSVEEILKREG